MQEERERGRIIGLRTRRLATAEWASGFIGLLAEARDELPAYADWGTPSNNAYARWLEQRSVPPRSGRGEWSSEKVRRLFDIHIGLIEEAEQEFDISIAIIRFKRQYADASSQAALAAEEVAVREYRARQINDAHRLAAALRGHPYRDQDIPPRLIKEKTTRHGKRTRKEEPVEVQLTLL
jgi:hypothetical protein